MRTRIRSTRLAKGKRIALVGPDTLLGRELRDLAGSSGSAIDLRLIASIEEETGRLTREGDEPTFIGGLEPENLVDAAAVLLAGTPASTRRALDAAEGPALIDLTYAAEDHPRARLRSVMVEPEGYETAADAIHIVAHPAAVALALLLGRLNDEYPIVRSVAHVFEPASERGNAGLQELQQQTVDLLSFKALPKEVFDAQLSFNLLAAYGEEAPHSLEDAELRVERHLASLLSLSGGAPMPSLRLIQAPVFHGHTFSLWIEFEENPGVEAIEHSLSGKRFDVRASGTEPPNIVGIAGQDEIGVGGVTLDRNEPQACWLWAVADNVRLAARNALLVAEQVLDAR
jgi:aspartate-semialdehyde dehydrogenase